MKKVEFRGQGISCIKCDAQLIFNSCNPHIEIFPKLSKEGGIQLPICNKCSVECSICGYSDNIVSYVKKINKPKPKKKEKKKQLYDAESVIKESDFSKIKNLNFFRKGTSGILDTIFSFDAGTQLAMADIRRKLGQNIPSNFSKLETSLTRLTSIYFSLMSIRLIGLSSYEKEIIEAEIKRLFSKGSKK